MLEALTEGLVFFNVRGELVDINERMLALGHTFEQLTHITSDPRAGVRRTDGSPFPLEERPLGVVLRTGRPVHDVEMLVPTVDGELRWRLVNAEPVHDEAGQLTGVVASLLDITERKAAEAAALERAARLAADAAAAQRLLELTERLWNAPSMDEGLTLILRASIDLVEADCGDVRLGDPSSQTCCIAAHHGFGGAFMDTFGEVWARDPFLSSALEGGASRVLIDDTEALRAAAPLLHDAARAAGVRTIEWTPLRGHHDRVVGVLSTCSRRAQSPGPDALRRLDLYARQAAAFIERHQLDEQRRQAESQYVWALSAAASGAWTWDASTDVSTWNDRFQELYGLPADARRTFQTWIDAVHPDDRSILASRFECIRRTPGDDRWDIEYRSTASDGTVVWHRNVGRADRDASGALTGMAGIDLDVTPRKRAEAELREVSVRLAAIHDHAPFGIVVSDVGSGRIISVNEAFTQTFGWTGEEAIGSTGIDLALVPEAVRRGIVEELRRRGAVRNLEVIARAKSGEELVVSLSAEILSVGEHPLIMTALADVTERKATEQALHRLRVQEREQAETMRLLMETSGQGIVTVTREGTVIAANPAIESMLGWGRGELVGQPLDRLIPPELRRAHANHQEHYWSAPRSRPMGSGLRLAALRKDGSSVPVEVSLNHVQTSVGDRAFAFVTDISERRRAEDALAERSRELERRAGQLQRLASELTLAEQHTREQLAKSLHDHLQQILFSGRLKVERLARRLTANGGADASLLDQVRQELDEAIAMARSLARELFPPMLHDSGLAAALNWLSGWAEEKYGLRVELSADPRANPARRDVRTLVFESVRELLFNVAKHARTDRAAVDLALTPDGSLRITVVDDGVGFDPASMLELDHGRGAGFGLLTIRERLALLGGRLDIDAAPGRGARFVLTAPRTDAVHASPGSDVPGDTPDAAAAGEGEMPTASAGAAPPLRIVIADDHPLVRDGLRQLFSEHHGLVVVGEAATGEEAVAMAAALRPDVVVMDVSMPKLDGVEATRRIRAQLPHIVVFGLSTQERGNTPHPIEEAGAVDYFTKGGDSHVLIERLLKVRPRADPA